MTRRKKTIPAVHKHLSREAIEQYLFAMPGQNVHHHTERWLLDDDFSADAVEGLGTQKNPRQLTANLADLENRLGKRVAQQRPRRLALPFGMQPYVVAASVALILMCAAAVVFSTRYLREKDLAAQTADNQKDAKAKAAVVSLSAPVFDDETTRATDPMEKTGLERAPANPTQNRGGNVAKTASAFSRENVSQHSQPATSQSPVSQSVVSSESALPVIIAQNPPSLEEKIVVTPMPDIRENDRKSKRENSISTNSQTPSAVANPRSAMSLGARVPVNAKGDSSQATRTVRGRVVDAEDGVGIPGAVVTVKGMETGTYTDQYGNYSIVVPAGYNEISFNFIGYIVFSSPIDGQQMLNAKLTPDVKSLSEVVVIGYGAHKDKETAFKPAQPESGMTGFIKTVEQSLSSSPYAHQLSASNTIRVSFTVQPDGSLSDVKMPRTACAECDAAAVQALRQAARWQPAQKDGVAVPQKMKVRIPLKSKKSK